MKEGSCHVLSFEFHPNASSFIAVSYYVHLLEAETQQRASVELVANLVMQVGQTFMGHEL